MTLHSPSEEKVAFLVQELYVNCRDMELNAKTTFCAEFRKGSAPVDLVKFVRINKLLEALCRLKLDQNTTFAVEGGYLRQVVHHSAEKITVSLSSYVY
jgi:hypothetical protein